MSNDWQDEFLFVGNQLSLDFLNTRPVIDGNPLELLPNSASLVRWLAAAGLLTKQEVNKIAKVWPARAEAEQEGLREFREAWRRVVFQLEAGGPPSPAFVDRLNDLLAQHPFVDEIVRSGSTLKRERRFDPGRPDDTFGPLLEETANLLTSADRSRIRKCASCALHFYDTSKKGTRRWCSMQMCGNRAKVAAYARRKRAEAE